MPVTTPATEPHTAAIIAQLVADTSRNIYDHKADPDAGTATAPYPYAVVYRLPSTGIDGTLDNWGAIVDLNYQVTSVGVDGPQAEWMNDQAVASLAGKFLTVAGRSSVQVVEWTWQAVQPDYDESPPLFYAPATFLVRSIKS